MKDLTSKKSLVFSLIVAQALILLFLIKNRVWNLDNFGHRFRDVWKSWKNDSEMLESDAEIYGMIDLKDQQFSWLNEPAKNITRSTTDSTAALHGTTVLPSKVNTSTGEMTALESMIIKPAIDESKEGIFFLVLVTTMPKSLERREIIRQTWARADQTPIHQRINVKNLPSYVVFMLGVSGDPNQDNAVDEEAEKHGDILRAPCKETYRNILDKVWFAFEWALPYHPKYILKVDDDVYVRIPRLSSWLSEGKMPNRLYAGFVHFRAYISRNPKDKHYVSKSQFKGHFFPNYCAGPCYMFSGELLDEFLEESKTVTKFKVEDAYLGLVAKKVGVKPVDIGGKLFVWDRSLSRSVRRWRDLRLSRVICLADSLTLEAMKYIHERYRKIDDTAMIDVY